MNEIDLAQLTMEEMQEIPDDLSNELAGKKIDELRGEFEKSLRRIEKLACSLTVDPVEGVFEEGPALRGIHEEESKIDSAVEELIGFVVERARKQCKKAED